MSISAPTVLSFNCTFCASHTSAEIVVNFAPTKLAAIASPAADLQ
jgi:hypothetical protein